MNFSDFFSFWNEKNGIIKRFNENDLNLATAKKCTPFTLSQFKCDINMKYMHKVYILTKKLTDSTFY